MTVERPKPPQIPFQQATIALDNHARVQNWTPSTAHSYRTAFRSFCQWAQQNRYPHCPTNAATIAAYRRHMEHEGKNVKTINNQHNGINAAMSANGFPQIPKPPYTSHTEPHTAITPPPAPTHETLSTRIMQLAIDAEALENKLATAQSQQQQRTQTRPPTSNAVIDRLHGYLIAKTRSESTRNQYLGNARNYLQWCSDRNLDPFTGNPDTLHAYLRHRQSQGVSPRTILNTHTAINHLLTANELPTIPKQANHHFAFATSPPTKSPQAPSERQGEQATEPNIA